MLVVVGGAGGGGRWGEIAGAASPSLSPVKSTRSTGRSITGSSLKTSMHESASESESEDDTQSSWRSGALGPSSTRWRRDDAGGPSVSSSSSLSSSKPPRQRCLPRCVLRPPDGPALCNRFLRSPRSDSDDPGPPPNATSLSRLKGLVVGGGGAGG